MLRMPENLLLAKERRLIHEKLLNDDSIIYQPNIGATDDAVNEVQAGEDGRRSMHNAESPHNMLNFIEGLQHSR